MNSFSKILTIHRPLNSFKATISKIKGDLKELDEFSNYLHPKEKKRYQSFPSQERQQSYLLGRLAAKKAIQKLTNIKDPASILVEAGVFEFPVVKGKGTENIQVSISHCDNIGVAIAFPEAHPMGIDVERVSRDKIDLLASQMTDREINLLKEQYGENPIHYTAIFSLKEALSKVIKTGMMLDFKFFEVDAIKEEGQVLECTFTHFGQYKAFAYMVEEYVFSIVLPKRTTVNLKEVWSMLHSIK